MNNIIKRVWNQNRLVNIEDLTGMVFQAESGGHTFEIRGIDDTGAAVELSGTVSGVFRRPDNADIALTGSASEGVVSVTLSEDCYAVPGRFGLTIFVTSNSQKVAVYACVGTVAVSSTGNVAGDTPASVEDLIDDINAAIADLNSAIGQIPASYANVMAAIAPTYSGSALYSVGSYAWYNGSLYRCTTPITTAESWTAAHWTAAVLGDDVGDLKSAFNTLDTEYHAHIVDCINLFNPDDTDIVENVELTTRGATASKTGYFASGYYPVIPGGTVCLHYPTGTYGSASKIYLYNADKSYRDVASSNVSRLTDSNGHTYIKYTFSASTQAKWFRVTGYMAAESYYMYVYAAEMPSTYVPYTTNKTLKDTDVDYSLLKNVSVAKADTAFINNTPVNLVDLSALEPGIITSSSSNGNIDTSGTYATNWVTTDYIPVEPGETYALCIFPGVNYGAGFLGIPYYDASKNFLGRVTQSGGSVGAIAERVTITIPNRSDIKYIRTSYYKSYTDTSGADHKRWWECQIFHASAWPTDMYVPYDGSDKIVSTRLDDTVSAKYNPLWGKSAVWDGDSICAADSDTGAGWPGRIAMANGMSYRNYAVAGGTIAENTGESVHSVCATLDTMLAAFPNADYVLIEGGTNDADILGDDGIGTFDDDDFSAEYIEALDTDTFSGALESIFYRLVTQMKGKHIGYIIPQKMGHTAELVARRRTYFDRAIDICKKWGIPYIDLWNDYYFNWELTAHWDSTMSTAENEAAGNLYIDGQHLTTTGYAIQAPVIAEWMKTI